MIVVVFFYVNPPGVTKNNKNTTYWIFSMW